VVKGRMPTPSSSRRFSMRIDWSTARSRLKAAWWLIQMIPMVRKEMT
jgi:hypothetical protein